MRRVLTLFTMLMLSGVLAFAQTRVVTGTVTDNNGQPIEGATVRVKGSRTGVAADVNGNFSISVPTGATLTVSGVGVTTQDFPVGNQTSLNFTVARTSASELSTVVVTALGQQRQSRELGYSTARVRSTELTQARVINLQNGLTGKVSGLNIQTVNNSVTADTRITLRGIRSLTGNNQPMLILDGVPISLSFLNSINPNDIADVSILKSATGTAIYGPEGANGAIIVTTRKGIKGRPTVNVSHTLQLEKVSFMPKFQTFFGSGSSVDANGFGIYDPIENQTYGDQFDGSTRIIGIVAQNGDSMTTSYTAKPDEKKKFWNTGITNQTDLSFSTGDFYVSAQNVDIKGVLPKDELKRNSVHLSANKEYNNFKAGFNLQYTQQNTNINAGSQFGNGRDYTPYWNLINTPIEVPVTRFKDWRNDYFSNPNQYFNAYYHNPYSMIDLFRQTGRDDNLFGDIELGFKATSWLNFTYRLGTTVQSSTSKATAEAFNYSAYAKANISRAATDLLPGVIDRASTSSRLNSELFVNLKKDFEIIKLDAILGHSFRRTKTNNSSESSLNLGIPGVYNVGVRRGELTGSQSSSEATLQRFFGRVGLSYSNWVFAEVTGSYDMDSRLAPAYGDFKMNDIAFFYPGASLSFVLTDAIKSLKDNKVLSFAKVRGAISKTGNVNLDPYSLENTFSSSTGFPYGSTLGFTANNTLRQTSYTPEFVVNKEVGLELGFLNNRINLEATTYKQDNTNQLITVAYSGATGFSSALLNAASFTNRGLELDLRLTPLIKLGSATVDFKVNYTHQQNKVTKLIEGVNELGIGNGNYVIVGMPAYTFKLTDYVKDSLGRVIVDAKTGLPSVDPNLKTFGQTLPTDLLGMSLNINWKGFSLSAVADYRTGNQIYSGIGPDMDFSGISYRSGQNGRQPFLFPNSVYRDVAGKLVPNTNIYTRSGGYDFYSQGINTTVDANYLASGAFWKLREVALSYNIPESVFRGMKVIKGATFTLTGRNLVTWLPSTNEWTDPEFSNTTGNAQGVNDRNNTPPTRIFGANLSLKF